MTKRVLLDMDGVLVDFLSGAIKALNRAHNRTVTLEQYAREFGRWGTYDYYGLTVEQFWAAIEENPTFWFDLDPMPWAEELYKSLSALGEVTIVTAPSNDPDCAKQKYQWLKRHLGITSSSVFLGHRKYLMAGNGILVDDYIKNIAAFKENGGHGILIPSTWNTIDLTFDRVWKSISDQI